MKENNKTNITLQYYGRRVGKSLSESKKQLLNEALPKYLIDSKAIENLNPNNPTYLEIGFGNGDHLYKQAKANPSVLFIGAEPFLNGVANLIQNLEENKITNVKIFHDDVRKILPSFKNKSLEKVFILFPDPWPKVRHNKRRIINTEFLNLLSEKMKKNSKLIFATDHLDYSTHFLSYILANDKFKWLAENPNDSLTPPPNWINTKYEQKAIKKQIQCMYFLFENKI